MTQTTRHLPVLKYTNGTWHLLVDGKPYLVLGAELQNSSMSSASYMETVWEKLAKMGVNTILGTVAWEDIERKEGEFDFSELDKVFRAARSHGFRVVLLWFGSFKNGMSCYVPSWVKQDPRRFPRMQLRQNDGSLQVANVISIFHQECLGADRKAFTKLMGHLKETDTDRTVIMVQVQNEVGLLGASRDAGATAERLFQSAVPHALVEFLQERWDHLLPDLKIKFPRFASIKDTLPTNEAARSWEGCFGQSRYTDELFMAYHYALYLEGVAIAGKQTYNIPLYTNVWMPKPGEQGLLGGIASGGNFPGEYPSGGPVPGVLDIWQRFAPSLDFIAPDIYTGDYAEICRTYLHNNQALFIPEQRRDEHGARRMWEAIGTFGALGATPFGVDTLDAETFAYTAHYKLLRTLSLHILKARENGLRTLGFYFDEVDSNSEFDRTADIVKIIGDYELHIQRAFVLGRPGPGYGLIIELESGRYLFAGKGYRVEFKSTSPDAAFTSILRCEEKSAAGSEDGTLHTERVFDGDETRSGRWVNMPNDAPDYGNGFIPLTVPARTMIAEVQVYKLMKDEILP